MVDDRTPSSPLKEASAARKEDEEEGKKSENVSESGKMDTSSSKSESISVSPSVGRPHKSFLSEQLSRPPTTLSRLSGPTSLSSSMTPDQLAQSQPSPPEQPPQLLPQVFPGESNELTVGSDVLLIDAQSIEQKKDVDIGPEIDSGDDNMSKLSLIEGSAQLDKELNTSNLEGGKAYLSQCSPQTQLKAWLVGVV